MANLNAPRSIATCWAVVALCLGALGHLSGCDVGTNGAAGQARQLLVGTWVLTSVDGKPPAVINVQSHVIIFGDKGEWKFESEASGLRLSGDGTWILQGRDRIAYTVGDNRGSTIFSVESGDLAFAADPVLVQPGGAGEVRTVYRHAVP